MLLGRKSIFTNALATEEDLQRVQPEDLKVPPGEAVYLLLIRSLSTVSNSTSAMYDAVAS